MPSYTSLYEMWQATKSFFELSGNTPGSTPIRYNIHLCDIAPSSTARSPGIQIHEDSMPLFACLAGGASPPPCTCSDSTAVVARMDQFLSTFNPTNRHPEDNSIHSYKNDTCTHQVQLYAMRDAISWWMHWGQRFERLFARDYWKVIYIAFTTVQDDIQMNPLDVLSGCCKFLGHTFGECLDGLLREGIPPGQVHLLDMLLRRQMMMQYVEKVDPSIWPLLRGRTTLMTMWRILTPNCLGCLIAILHGEAGAAEEEPEDDSESDGASLKTWLDGHDFLSDGISEAAGLTMGLSMDMSKEPMGVLEGEHTEFVKADGKDRDKLRMELNWCYARGIDFLDSQPDGAVHQTVRLYATSGFHFTPNMDRYQERKLGRRVPISEGLGRILAPFVKGEKNIPAAAV
ncbi:hypothetical protein QBC44DRAFT_401948 [Cladorrhinum sp. PSN332]|nr:hypothetical protein QBC44DRAFT_401948 [Cladorrhinum sp. PSN332]